MKIFEHSEGGEGPEAQGVAFKRRIELAGLTESSALW